MNREALGLLALLALITAAAVSTGWKLGRRGGRPLAATGVAGCALLLSGVALAQRPAWIPESMIAALTEKLRFTFGPPGQCWFSTAPAEEQAARGLNRSLSPWPIFHAPRSKTSPSPAC